VAPITVSGMISRLHEGQDDAFQFEPKEGQHRSSCSNEAPSCCPSLGFNSHLEDEALKYLARILVEAFLDIKNDEKVHHTAK
jgi:hypothetical protein